jgi:hypothetical protein
LFIILLLIGYPLIVIPNYILHKKINQGPYSLIIVHFLQYSP